MGYAVYACLVLLIAIAVMSALTLSRADRPAVLPTELTTRLAVLEQVAAGLPVTFRDEARISREHVRSAISGQAETLQRTAARTLVQSKPQPD